MTSQSLIELRAQYKEAEDAIKLYERVSLDNLVAAVNELRYAGHHLLAYETEKDPVIKSDLMSRVAHHCERAKYDAKEATIIALLEEMADFRDQRFSSTEMDLVLPGWRDVFAASARAVKTLELAGSVKAFEDNTADIAIKELLDARDKLSSAAFAINELRHRREEENEKARRLAVEDAAKERFAKEVLREKRDDRRHILNVALAAMGIVLSALGLVMMFV